MSITRKQSVNIVCYDILVFLTGSSLPYTGPIPLLCLKLCLKKIKFIFTNQTCYWQQSIS